MKILWFTWKDRKNPLAGGAEVVNEELAKRLSADGHEVIFLVGGFDGGAVEEERDGLKIVRMGGRFSVYWHVYKYYKKHLVGWADIVIDEVNTIPFFAKFYVKEKNILFVHQLAREIWFYQMFFPLNVIGYLIEPMYLWLLRDRQTITISESTKKDLMRFGYKAEKISIISEGIELSPIQSLESVVKYKNPTMLSLGAVRPMKRTLDIVKAFEIAKITMPNLRLIVAGDKSGRYGDKVMAYINQSAYKYDIEVLGRVSVEKKLEVMQRSHVIAVTSVKEGWGLIVTEANSQGTPAVVYDVDGLRDSVINKDTGYVASKNIPVSLALCVNYLLKDVQKYSIISLSALSLSKKINFTRSYKQFLEALV